MSVLSASKNPRQLMAGKMKHIIAWSTIVILAYCAFLVPITAEAFRFYGRVFSVENRLWLLAVIAGPLLLIGAYRLNGALRSLDKRWLEFSLFKLKENASITSMRYPLPIAIAYLALLGFCVPMLAGVEELIFRNWLTGPVAIVLWGGVVFGLVHMLVGVTVRMSINNGVLGVILGIVYTIAESYSGATTALAIVTIIHASYNYVALMLIAYELQIQERIASFLQTDSRFATYLVSRFPGLPGAVGTVSTS